MLVAGLLLLLVAAALAVAQLLLPRLAERHIAERLGPAVVRVRVRAFPALKVLRGRADDVLVLMSETSAGAGRLGELIDVMRDAHRVEARVGRARVGPLLLRDVRVHKIGDELALEAAVGDDDLTAALPPTVGLRPVHSDAGDLVFEASTGLLPRASLRARVSAQEGAIVIAPELPLGGLARFTVFSDPALTITDVASAPRAGGFTLTAQALIIPRRGDASATASATSPVDATGL